MLAASTEDWAVVQLCGFVLRMKTGTSLKLITLLLQHNTFNSQSSTSFVPFLEISLKVEEMKIKNRTGIKIHVAFM